MLIMSLFKSKMQNWGSLPRARLVDTTDPLHCRHPTLKLAHVVGPVALWLVADAFFLSFSAIGKHSSAFFVMSWNSYRHSSSSNK